MPGKLKRLLFIATIFFNFAGFGVVSDVFAAASESQRKCQSTYKKPLIEFDVQTVPQVLNKSLTSNQITRFAAKRGKLVPLVGHKLLGLAFVEVDFRFQIQTAEARIDGRSCISLRQVAVSFGRKKSEIFVAKEYRPGTCQFRAILRHEQEHMDINARIQKKYEKKIQQFLISKAKSIQPYFTTSPTRAPEELAGRFGEEIKRLISQFNEERQRENNKIDTPKSYQKVRAQCAGW
ncbi:hypothetical protein [Sneathiella glossodoripedis]|uniref:hypothetical protein n=1 Tax=Sneathiella glossodoripedis TaxID=418853 RepID=UPI00046FA3AF|nr:hypothetical protein [Sneathiella glossodoripedis]